VKKESLRVPPKAVFTSLRRLLIAGRLERGSVFESEKNGWGKMENLNLPAVKIRAVIWHKPRKRES
jgi:hypothetical protein